MKKREKDEILDHISFVVQTILESHFGEETIFVIAALVPQPDKEAPEGHTRSECMVTSSAEDPMSVLEQIVKGMAAFNDAKH